MVKIFKKMMVLLDARQKRIMVLQLILMLIGAILETAGISMVVPVMQVVLEENAVAKHRYLQVICDDGPDSDVCPQECLSVLPAEVTA